MRSGAVVEDDLTRQEHSSADAGPPCGMKVARTMLTINYIGPMGRRVFTKTYCCHRDTPKPSDILPTDAIVLWVTMEDRRTVTLATADHSVVLVKR